MSSDIRPVDGAGDDPLPSNASPAHWQDCTVLVVDDHPAYRMMMSAMLQQLGLGCETCGDGQAALAALDGQPFDLILTDCQMPVMNGYALAHEVRRRERESMAEPVPIVALTSNLGPNEVHQCLDAGINAWLIKPLTFGQLRNVLLYWLADGTPLVTDVPRTREEDWPTRARLVQLFGSAQVLDGMLASLVQEVRQDLQALSHAMAHVDADQTAQHLHRLIGSVAFLGGTPLEARGIQLISAVTRDGVALHARALFGLRQDLVRYVEYLKAL
ncbi:MULTISPECIES: response regulator [Pseudomonas]|uniref:response regulator n=1 Tax=Pseudomonas TaxID=286 RepID=UPI000C889A8E|nr:MULTISPECIES: response regulator [unclassified Pseudomonas]PMX11315.1 response regulator [Pseudomonas sp. GW460-12]PMX32377.1 response regulator [Pseudomonas sp. MPR-R2A4]PMX38372.1 response regulator [Pseudomonas sp. MPR-R2A7]PMX54912.1 response regulator [Pseudomonas sp. MPR-R2A6]PMX88327.1 response regulator [Pseudomonas sp. MPR-R2A3]